MRPSLWLVALGASALGAPRREYDHQVRERRARRARATRARARVADSKVSTSRCLSELTTTRAQNDTYAPRFREFVAVGGRARRIDAVLLAGHERGRERVARARGEGKRGRLRARGGIVERVRRGEIGVRGMRAGPRARERSVRVVSRAAERGASRRAGAVVDESVRRRSRVCRRGFRD